MERGRYYFGPIREDGDNVGIGKDPTEVLDVAGNIASDGSITAGTSLTAGTTLTVGTSIVAKSYNLVSWENDIVFYENEVVTAA